MGLRSRIRKLKREGKFISAVTKAPPPSSSIGGVQTLDNDKICIVCEYRCHLFIYVLDIYACDNPNRSNLTIKHPTFILDNSTNYDMPCLRYSAQGLCVSGSTLYFIDGSKSVYSYKFPSNVTNIENFKLERHMLERITDMNAEKPYCNVIATPDMKSILVYSKPQKEDRSFGYSNSSNSTNDCNIEMYYPGDGRWENLRIPVDPYHGMKQSEFKVSSHKFIDDNQLVVVFETDMKRKSALNLSFPNQLCPDYDQHNYEDGHIVLFRGQLRLTSACAYDEYGNAYDYPDLTYSSGERITLLSVDHGECKFCVVQTAIHNSRPELEVKVYKLDLEEYKNGKRVKKVEDEGYKKRSMPLPGIDIIKSFKFSLHFDAAQGDRYLFRPGALYSFQ